MDFTGTWHLDSVIDTRQWREVNYRWRAVPGTGQARPCAICGRTHEVWAVIVRKEDGRAAIVGVACCDRAYADRLFDLRYTGKMAGNRNWWITAERGQADSVRRAVAGVLAMVSG